MTIRIENNMHLGQIRRQVDEVSRDALQAGADVILHAAEEKVPVLEDVHRANREEIPGTMLHSGYTRILDDDTAEIGFTDFAAAWQHEDMSYHHDHGQAKFLEEPMATEVERVMEAMAAKLRERLT